MKCNVVEGGVCCGCHSNIVLAQTLKKGVDDQLKQWLEPGAKQINTHRHEEELKTAVERHFLENGSGIMYDRDGRRRD